MEACAGSPGADSLRLQALALAAEVLSVRADALQLRVLDSSGAGTVRGSRA